MPRYIVKLVDKLTNKDYYLLWSTVVDAPVMEGLNLTEFTQVYREDYYGLSRNKKCNAHMESDLAERMERVQQKGTSSMIDENADRLVSFNRAGPGEAPLSYDELVRFYCLGEKPDEHHACWKLRRKEFDRRSDVNGGLNYSDEKEVFHMFPYTDAPRLEGES